jgi:hypothetical protein
MEFETPLRLDRRKQASSHSLEPFAFVSCNIRKFELDFDSVLKEIQSKDLDLILFQEAWKRQIPQSAPASAFPEWTLTTERSFCVSSRYPVTIVGSHRRPKSNFVNAIALRVDRPDGPVLVCNVQSETIQFELKRLLLNRGSPLAERLKT